MKKIFAVLLCLVMLLGVCACTPAGGEDVTPVGDEGGAYNPFARDPIIIGVEAYDTTDSDWIAMTSYFNYLGEKLNLQFIYSEALASAEDELAFVQNCAAAGAKGIYGYYNISPDIVATCAEYEMYYTGGAAQYEETINKYIDTGYLIGWPSEDTGNYQMGYQIALYCVENGYKNIVWANGGTDFGVPQFVQRTQGFVEGMETADYEYEITNFSGFPNETWFAEQGQILANPDYDCIATSFNCVDFWAQQVANTGREDLALVGVGTINETAAAAFSAGTVNAIAAGTHQTYGLAVMMLVNAVEGNIEKFYEDGHMPTIAVERLWMVTSAEEMQGYYDICVDGYLLTADEMMTLLYSANPEADFEYFEEIANSNNDLESILARKAALGA